MFEAQSAMLIYFCATRPSKENKNLSEPLDEEAERNKDNISESTFAISSWKSNHRVQMQVLLSSVKREGDQDVQYWKAEYVTA